MTVYTYSEARQKLAQVLDQAQREGSVQIRRRDGSVFTIKPNRPSRSPFDVAGVDTGVTRDEIVSAIREGRERSRDQ